MTAHEDGWYEMKALYIARAEEAAKNYGLVYSSDQNGIWITMIGSDLFDKNPNEDIDVVKVKARGWKNASDAFIKAATEWSQKKRDVQE